MRAARRTVRLRDRQENAQFRSSGFRERSDPNGKGWGRAPAYPLLVMEDRVMSSSKERYGLNYVRAKLTVDFARLAGRQVRGLLFFAFVAWLALWAIRYVNERGAPDPFAGNPNPVVREVSAQSRHTIESICREIRWKLPASLR